MNEYKRPPGHECPPPPETPAGQPRPPGKGDPCKDLPTKEPPTLADPKPCPPPDPKCRCPNGNGTPPNCLEELIAAQADEIAKAEKAKTFKTDLESLLGKAKSASQEYTRDRYDKLVKLWVEVDSALAELIRKLVCAVPCWRCVIDCHVCPLLDELHYLNVLLYGDGTLYADVKNLYDLQYWLSRDKDTKALRMARIKSVLDVWCVDKPSLAIEKTLNDTKTQIAAANLGTEAGKTVYDVFLKIVPLHLAIAPPSGSGVTTRIGKEYTDFCTCDTGEPDDCCGPDVGRLGLRQQLIGPQMYLIDPANYFALICCLVEKRYVPAKEAFNTADSQLTAVEGRIARYKAQIASDLTPKTFEAKAKVTIPSAIDCCDYESEEPAPKSYQSR